MKPTPMPADASADPTISVVIPCYNGLPFLSQSLDSALAQSHRPTQIIVVDDGSTDNSPEVVREYQHRYPDRGLALIQQVNGGEPAARNTGIKATTGDWVAMLDTDDWWEPDKLQKQLATAEAAGPECVLVHTGVVGHFPDGREDHKPMEAAARRTGWCTQALLEPASIGHPSIMVRREALARIGGYDESFKQACDIDLYFRLSAIGAFAFVPEYLLHYRYHAKQMSASQVTQIGYHHRAARQFFQAHPQWAQRIGRERIDAALADHVAVKLESLYWRRSLGDFRRLLGYAREYRLDNPAIRAWRSRAVWPNWLIYLKDRLRSHRKGHRIASAPVIHDQTASQGAV